MQSTPTPIRCSKPAISELERRIVNSELENGNLGLGEYIGLFEKQWAAWNGYQYGVSCNSGTNAIYLALKALGIGEGDEVIVPEYTMIATAWAVSYTGAKPVFVDCKDDLNIDVDKICVTERTKAIVGVPIYGRPLDERIYTMGVPVVEDMAEAHGIKPKGKAACYSFYGNKILTTGEGGMVLTNDSTLQEQARLYANMYFDKERTMIHPKMGHNFRMTNLQAAIGYIQAIRINELLRKRKQVEEWYDEFLVDEVKRPKREVVWMYDIDCHERQEEVKRHLEEYGIESRYYFKPMSMQPMYLGEHEHLNAYKWSKRGLYLPTYPDLKKEEVKFISDTINELWSPSESE